MLHFLHVIAAGGTLNGAWTTGERITASLETGASLALANATRIAATTWFGSVSFGTRDNNGSTIASGRSGCGAFLGEYQGKSKSGFNYPSVATAVGVFGTMNVHQSSQLYGQRR